MKKSICVIFGGMSTEHEISISSGTSIIENIDKNKYNVVPIYIDKKGNWYYYKKDVLDIKILPVGVYPKELKNIDNIIVELKKYDLVFPVLHGLYGEDGSIQGLFEMFKIKYVGCKILSSSLAMDKVYAKIMFEKANIKCAKYLYFKKSNNKLIYVDNNFNEKEVILEDINKLIIDKLKYPVFIKPSNSGSSVGVNKVNNINELEDAINKSFTYDRKILIEEAIVGKELECAVMDTLSGTVASVVGEINTSDQFYSYDSKYKNSFSKTIIPASIGNSISLEIRKLAIKAFNSIDGCGISRVDFFVDKDNNIYLNEINTLPGFTDISMYPKLFMYDKISYSEIIDNIIENSL